MLLPYASDRPPRHPPLVVVSLVLLNFLVFGLVALVLRARGPQADIGWYVALALVPKEPRWYSFVTYAFLHDSVFHLSGNMLFLWVFGGSVEEAMGWRRFLGFYLLAVVVTGLLQAGMARVLPGMDALTPVIGASGAAAAVVGVFAVRFYRSRIRFIGLPWRVPALVLVAAVLFGEMVATVWQLVRVGPAGGGPSVAHWAHIGGFVLGMAFAQLARMQAAGHHEYLQTDAATLLERGEPLSAARRWEAVLKTDPANAVAEAELGKAWAAAGDREAARRSLSHAVATLLQRGDKRAAAHWYREARASLPGFLLPPTEQFTVAGALEEQGAYSDAALAFEALLRSGQAGAREAEMARLRLGVLYLNRLNDRGRAIRELRAFVATHPASEWRAYAEDLLRTAEAANGGTSA